MRWEVLAQLVDDNGEAVWGVHRDEIVPTIPIAEDPEREAEENADALLHQLRDVGADMQIAVEYVAGKLADQVSGTLTNMERHQARRRSS